MGWVAYSVRALADAGAVSRSSFAAAGPVPAVAATVGALLLASAVIDARSRTFPNALFAGLACSCAALSWAVGGWARLACSCAALSWAVGGWARLAGCTAASLAMGAALTAFELGWRRLHGGAPGMGMGDVKFLAAMALWRPFDALASFALGMLFLACAGAVLRRGSLPLLPFAVPAFVALQIARALGIAT